MSNEDWKKAEELTYSILDSIDLIPYIKKHDNEDVYSLIWELECEYGNSEQTNNESLEGCLFNVIGECEFIDYLEKRYGPKFSTYEVIQHKIIFNE